MPTTQLLSWIALILTLLSLLLVFGPSTLPAFPLVPVAVLVLCVVELKRG